MNIYLFIDTTEGWNHIAQSVELHCLDSTLYQIEEEKDPGHWILMIANLV